jgi:predicted DNA-binding transcriptional regulator AlpA
MKATDVAPRMRTEDEHEHRPKSLLRRGRNGSRKRLVHMTETLPKSAGIAGALGWLRADEQDDDRILTLAQAEKVVPFSRSTLYRVAEDGEEDSPFKKRRGRWLTTRSDLFRWVREGERGTASQPPNGRSRRPGRGRSSFAERVAELEGSAR